MKKITRLALLCCLIAGCGAANPVKPPAPPSPNKDWTITTTWNYDFTNFVPCSSTVTKGCITGFTWGFTQGSVSVPLKTSPASVCTGTAQPLACSDVANSTLGIGPTIFYVVANGIDNTGAIVASTPDNSASQNVAIGTASNISVSLK